MDDGSGIVATGYPPDTQWARDLRTSMERGDINQMSFRFQALEDDIAVGAFRGRRRTAATSCAPSCGR